jgi:hypothetical protein
MSEVHIADDLRIDAPIGVVWHAIEDLAAHARWHPFVSAIAGGARPARDPVVLGAGRQEGGLDEGALRRA